MRDETLQCLLMLHHLEISVYRWEAAGMNDVVDQLGHHLQTVCTDLDALTPDSVKVAPVLMRGEDASHGMTFNFTVQPTSMDNARIIMNNLIPLLNEAEQGGVIRGT